MKLKDKIAIVTGASRGIGKGIANVLAREGAIVVLISHSDKVYEAAKEIQAAGFKAVAFKADVTNFNEAKHAVDKVLEQFGRVDILVNNAGIYPYRLLIDMTEELWDKVLATNLKSVFNFTKAVLPTMIKQKSGKIINTCHLLLDQCFSTRSNSLLSFKRRCLRLYKGVALEVTQYGINVNAVRLGWVDTPGLREEDMRRFGVSAEEEQKRIEQMSKSIPIGRLAKPEEVGELVLFLASEESKYITGAEIVIDGGNIIQEEKICCN